VTYAVQDGLAYWERAFTDAVDVENSSVKTVMTQKVDSVQTARKNQPFDPFSLIAIFFRGPFLFVRLVLFAYSMKFN